MIGEEIHKFAEKLWPLNRSITGQGVRDTLNLISQHLPNLKIESIKTGTKVFDWVIPKEWFVRKAYIITPNGEKICDYSKNNLHLIGYSIPFSGKVSLDELKNHLYTLPDKPSAIPYVTSYYEERWGFCISYEELNNLKNGEYEVVIDTILFDGVLNYGELLIKGKSDKEILLSTYICHPSMANNELSGPSVVTFLANWLEKKNDLNFSYRIIFVPETIGSIAYLSRYYKIMKKKTIAGFNVSCVGDERAYSYLPSRNGKTLSDLIAKHVLKWIDPNYVSYTWFDRGSDERQYCAPGIDLPVASIFRTKYGKYPEYHSSLDDLKSVVTPKGLDGGYWAIRQSIEAIEKNTIYRNLILCEPQLGKRGLKSTLSTNSSNDQNKNISLIMNFISFCDGKLSLLEIAEKLDVPMWDLYDIINVLEKQGIIKREVLNI